MISEYDNYLQELHDRNYSFYDDSEAEKSALQELRDRSYLIFDEEETLNLMIDYENEFDRLSNKMSFVSQQNMSMLTNVFGINPKPCQIVNEELNSKSHNFYIHRDFEPTHTCIATGHYDFTAKVFVLHKGSILSLEVASVFRYSAADIQRRVFIKENCAEQSNGYRLKNDHSFSSPDQAACYVLGIHADGWKEWIDDDGEQLGEVYNKTSETEKYAK